MTESNIETIFCNKRIVPVLVIEDLSLLLPLLDALDAGGLNTIEITLRSTFALTAIERARAQRPKLIVGAGTITNNDQLQAAHRVGAQFCVSPGFSEKMVRMAADENIALLPGVATATEVMQALDLGVKTLKLFPVEAIGGPKLLAALAGPFPNVNFCPTGGINAENAPGYLMETNVCALAGSWMVPHSFVAAKQWANITELAQAAVMLGNKCY